MKKEKIDLASELLLRLKDLGPKFLEHRLESKNASFLPEKNVSQLIESGIFKACQPKRVGGFELPFGVQTSAGAEIAKLSVNHAWERI